jgi:hypothetical protein
MDRYWVFLRCRAARRLLLVQQRLSPEGIQLLRYLQLLQ